MRCLKAIGLSISALACAVLSAGCVVDRGGLPFREVAEGPDFPRIANCYGAGIGPRTTTEKLDFLAKYDLLIGGLSFSWWNADDATRAAVNEKLAYLKQKNSKIILLDFSSSARNPAE